MDVDEQQRLRTDPTYNFYIVSTTRPNAQLFAVRAEWEIEATADSDSGDGSDDEADGYHIAAIQFAGLPHLVIGVPRSTHKQVLALAEELKFRIVAGHPMTNNKEHFPLEASADSIFTLESMPGSIKKKNLKSHFKKEKRQILNYLAARNREAEKEEEDELKSKRDPNRGVDGDEDCPEIEITLLPEGGKSCDSDSRDK